MKLRVKPGMESEFESRVMAASALVQGLGYKGAAKMTVALKLDRAMFHVTGNKRIRIKRMTRLFKKAMWQNVFELCEKVS